MKHICQIYLPGFYRSFKRGTIHESSKILPTIKELGYSGVYLIALWQDGEHDNGFDITEYAVNPRFGSDKDFKDLIKKAHKLGLTVGVDVVPNHVSDLHPLALYCLSDIPGYEDCLYAVSKEEAERLTEAGVPSFFGNLAYSNFGDKYIRSTFADYHQLNLNWESEKVQEYFEKTFRRLKDIEIDFARIDCGMMLFEDVSKASKENPLACMNPKRSIEAIREVSGGMKLFYEWFDPESVYLFEGMANCYALDCSYVMTREQNTNWHHPKLVPLVGGHDQMTLADRGMDALQTLIKMESSPSEYGFSDLATLMGWKTDSFLTSEDKRYDADWEKNPNQRYRARRDVARMLHELDIRRTYSKGIYKLPILSPEK